MILNIIKEGLKLKFLSTPTFKNTIPISNFSDFETKIIDQEISKLLDKKVIYECSPSFDQFVSPIFLREKKNKGTYRFILNLKKLNEQIEYNHFKMESLQTITNVIVSNAWMASLDLKDAYYCIKIFKQHQRFLRFSWNGKMFAFSAMPNGYADAPRSFTKILKVPFSNLRERGFISVIYIDDTYLQGDSIQDCLDNVLATKDLLEKLGFFIHPEKSAIKPSQVIEFLGFCINSRNLSISLSKDKECSIMKKIHSFLEDRHHTILELASLIGSFISILPAVPFGSLHYRNLERFKIASLKKSKGNFEAYIDCFPDILKQDLFWWIDNLPNSMSKLAIPSFDYIITTDASLEGWGATNGVLPTGGRWSETDLAEFSNINSLELGAIFMALKSYIKDLSDHKHVRILTDNTSAKSYIKHMGGVKSINCDAIAQKIWDFAIKHDIWISAEYIPGKMNTIADKKSREFNDNLEWRLCPKIFKTIVNNFSPHFLPSIDMFASRLNNQLEIYASFQPDPNAIIVDSFSVPWTDHKSYFFPPFSMISRTVSKILRDQAVGILICPDWKGQPWYPLVMKHLIAPPLILPQSNSTLKLPNNPSAVHPLSRKMTLMALLVSGRRLTQIC